MLERQDKASQPLDREVIQGEARDTIEGLIMFERMERAIKGIPALAEADARDIAAKGEYRESKSSRNPYIIDFSVFPAVPLPDGREITAGIEDLIGEQKRVVHATIYQNGGVKRELSITRSTREGTFGNHVPAIKVDYNDPDMPSIPKENLDFHRRNGAARMIKELEDLAQNSAAPTPPSPAA